MDTIPKKGQFEFLIKGDLEFDSENWTEVLTPNSFEVEEIIKDDWSYFKVGKDEFSYSFEDFGIQMTFNKEMDFEKAKKIVDEIIENIILSGQTPSLQIIDNKKVYHLK